MLARITTSLALLAALVAGPAPASAGFVTTSGTKFQLDGKPFHVYGTNAYWASETLWSPADLKTIFTEMAKNVITVCRTWGFNDVTSVPSWGAYYQLWTNGKPTINTGATGLAYFDTVVAAAKAAGVKLVVPLVNNWSDYGGMDVYAKALGGKNHDDFYTSETVKDAYKAYIKTFVTRYKDDDTIMTWELANESRCGGSGGGLPRSLFGCSTKTITAWMTEVSAYIKSVDLNHLVAAGDEGFMNTNALSYTYSGWDGVDFGANLKIATLDYGTYHAYPDNWVVLFGQKDWGLNWIKAHVAAGNAINKSVIMEEYGVKSKDVATYKAWSDLVLSLQSNMQYWQFGLRSLNTSDDGFTVYTTDALFASTIAPAAAAFKAKN